MPEEIPKTLKPKVQMSVSGPNRWGGILNEEFLQELRFPAGIKVYNEMRKNSPIIGGFLRAIEAAFRSAKFTAVPWDDSDEARDRAIFLEQCIDDMERPWADVLADILTFLPFGFAALEMVFKSRKGPNGKVLSKHDDGRIGLKDLVLVPHNSIVEWIYDEENDPNELIGLKQMAIDISFNSRTGDDGMINIPLRKIMLVRVRPEKNSPEGESILRQCYRSWYFMNNLEVVEAISLERTGAGIPMVELPEQATSIGEETGSSDEQKARDIVSQVRVDEQGGVVVPHGWIFSLVSTTGLRPELFDLAIKVDARGNAGVFMRVGDLRDHVSSGFEVQILDTHGKKKVGAHDCGGVIGTAAPSKNMVRPAGQWNRYVITLIGHDLKVVLNGEQIIDLDTGKSRLKDRPAKGYISFQDEGKRVWYRNVRIRELN